MIIHTIKIRDDVKIQFFNNRSLFKLFEITKLINTFDKI
jgi:hypothetical protein